jgi:hypothetical protein
MHIILTGDTMINHCINPLCDEKMQRLGIGELYSHEIREVTSLARRTEFFWICPVCAKFLTIRLDKLGHPTAGPKSELVDARWPLPGHDLRLAFLTGPGRRRPWSQCDSQDTPPVLRMQGNPVLGEVA